MSGSRISTFITWVLVATTAVGTGTLNTFGFARPPNRDVEVGDDGAPFPDRQEVRVGRALEPVPDPAFAPRPGRIPSEVSPPPTDFTRAQSALYAYRCPLAAGGLLTGRLEAVDPRTGVPRPAASVDVLFFQNERLASRVHVTTNGVFEAPGLAPGPCAVVAAGPDGFLAFAIDVLPASWREQPSDRPADGVGRPHAIDALLMAPIDLPVMESLVSEHLQSLAATQVPPDAAPLASAPAVPGPAGVRGPAAYSGPGGPAGRVTAGVTGPLAMQFGQLLGPGPRTPLRPAAGQPAGRGRVPPVVPVPFPEDFEFPDGPVVRAVRPVVQQPALSVDQDGLTIGRVVTLGPVTAERPATAVRVVFIAEGTIVGESPVDRHGLFRVKGLQPRQYSMVTIGTDGFAAFGIEVHRSQVQAKAGTADLEPVTDLSLPGETEGTQLVSFLEEQEGGAAVPAPPGRDTLVNLEYALIDLGLLLNLTPEQLAQCCGGGGYSGGGGGGGGGGGFDALALLGLLGLLGLLHHHGGGNHPGVPSTASQIVVLP